MEEKIHPTCGVDYPGTFQEFDEWFSTEEACLAYISKLRWPKGFVCPSCGIVEAKPSIMGRGLGRIRLSIIQNVSAKSLHEFILNNVQKGATVRTDGWKGYNGLEDMGYKHIVTNIAENGDLAHVDMPRVHRVASLFDRWWLGTHQGAIRPLQLAYYLDEFTFRFYRRNSKARGLLFYRLMQHAVACAPVKRPRIVGG